MVHRQVLCNVKKCKVRHVGNNKFNAYEPRREKIGLRDFRPGLTQTELYKLEGSRKIARKNFSKSQVPGTEMKFTTFEK